MIIKALRGCGYKLREIMEMDDYEIMIELGMAMYENEGEEGAEDG